LILTYLNARDGLTGSLKSADIRCIAPSTADIISFCQGLSLHKGLAMLDWQPRLPLHMQLI
jgi:hypothetical protein